METKVLIERANKIPQEKRERMQELYKKADWKKIEDMRELFEIYNHYVAGNSKENLGCSGCRNYVYRKTEIILNIWESKS